MSVVGATFASAAKAGALPGIVSALHGGGPVSGIHPGSLPGTINYTPDYQTLLQNDPGFMALKQNLSAQGIQDSAQRKQAINQALIQYGALPDFGKAAAALGISANDLQGMIDPATAGLAAANTKAGLSTTARLQQQEDQAMLGLRNNLAARGALSSGDDAYRTNLQNQSYEQAQSDALNSLLGALGGYQQNYVTAQQGEQNQLSGGLTDALSRLESNPLYAPSSLNYNPHSGKYVSGAGGTYTPTKQNGTWYITSDQTGQQFTLNSDGSLSPA